MVEIPIGNLFDGITGSNSSDEQFDDLFVTPNLRIERIISTGQTTPLDAWYDQAQDEWVMVVAGSARLQIEGEPQERRLEVGDWLLLPAHCRHRVTWTQSHPATVWLAVHASQP